MNNQLITYCDYSLIIHRLFIDVIDHRKLTSGKEERISAFFRLNSSLRKVSALRHQFVIGLMEFRIIQNGKVWLGLA